MRSLKRLDLKVKLKESKISEGQSDKFFSTIADQTSTAHTSESNEVLQQNSDGTSNMMETSVAVLDREKSSSNIGIGSLPDTPSSPSSSGIGVGTVVATALAVDALTSTSAKPSTNESSTTNDKVSTDNDSKSDSKEGSMQEQLNSSQSPTEEKTESDKVKDGNAETGTQKDTNSVSDKEVNNNPDKDVESTKNNGTEEVKEDAKVGTSFKDKLGSVFTRVKNVAKPNEVGDPQPNRKSHQHSHKEEPKKNKDENRTSMFKNERSDTYRRDFIKANPPFKIPMFGEFYLCSLCFKLVRVENMEVDHIFPVSKGGSNETFNLGPLCRPCNREKSNKVDSRIVQMFIVKMGGKGIGVPLSLVFKTVTGTAKLAFGTVGWAFKNIVPGAFKIVSNLLGSFFKASFKGKIVIVFVGYLIYVMVLKR